MSPGTLAVRSFFLRNLFARSRIARTFKMAPGYLPGIESLKQSKVNTNIIKAQLSRSARRPLQRLLTSHKHDTVRKAILQKGRKIWFFDKDNNWHQVEVSMAEDHFVTCRWKKNGPSMKIAYENIRMALSNPIDHDLLTSEVAGGVQCNIDEPSNAQTDQISTLMRHSVFEEKEGYSLCYQK